MKYKERVLEAQKQGLIDDATMQYSNNYKVRRYNSDKDSYGLSYESYVQNMNDKAEEMFSVHLSELESDLISSQTATKQGVLRAQA